MPGVRIGGQSTAARGGDEFDMGGPAGEVEEPLAPDMPLTEWDALEAEDDDGLGGFNEPDEPEPDDEDEDEDDGEEAGELSGRQLVEQLAQALRGQQQQGQQQPAAPVEIEVPSFDDFTLGELPEDVELSPATVRFIEQAIRSGIQRGIRHSNSVLPATLSEFGRANNAQIMSQIEYTTALREVFPEFGEIPNESKIALALAIAKDPKIAGESSMAKKAKLTRKLAKRLGFIHDPNAGSGRGSRKTDANRGGSRAGASGPTKGQQKTFDQRHIDSMNGPGGRQRRRVSL